MVILPLFSEGGRFVIIGDHQIIVFLVCVRSRMTRLWRTTDDSSNHAERNGAHTRYPGESTPSNSPRHAAISGTVCERRLFSVRGTLDSVLDPLRITSPLTSELRLMSPVTGVNETGRLSSANLCSGDSEVAAGQQSRQQQCQALSVRAHDAPAANISLT